VCLDFDGVLHDPQNREPGYKMGKPVHGAMEACWGLVADGHVVIVHTARVGAIDHVQHVADWLTYFGFPVLPITVHKPIADVYVDDKALRFVDWHSCGGALERMATQQ
jgi:hypothetical protein